MIETRIYLEAYDMNSELLELDGIYVPLSKEEILLYKKYLHQEPLNPAMNETVLRIKNVLTKEVIYGPMVQLFWEDKLYRSYILTALIETLSECSKNPSLMDYQELLSPYIEALSDYNNLLENTTLNKSNALRNNIGDQLYFISEIFPDFVEIVNVEIIDEMRRFKY